MAASSPHQSAAPQLQTSHSPRHDSGCGDAAFARAPQPTNALPLGKAYVARLTPALRLHFGTWASILRRDPRILNVLGSLYLLISRNCRVVDRQRFEEGRPAMNTALPRRARATAAEVGCSAEANEKPRCRVAGWRRGIDGGLDRERTWITQ
jgi:hypothetical protein